ncbi:MAG: helical backbone metal receptor [Bacteroidales bacterium]|nr:helical backbone metal receptor [Bacteroidales bacterium]
MQYFDDLKREVKLKEAPKTVVSLCPSITETLCDLALEKNLKGVTDYCRHPYHLIKRKPRVGGPKDPDIEKIKQLNPALVLASKEESSQKAIKALHQHVPCYVFDIKNFEDALGMIVQIGELFSREHDALIWISDIEKAFRKLKQPKTPFKVLYPVWKNPWMAAGKNTFIDSMITKIGFSNVIEENAYPKINLEDYINKADLILLPSEPYEFNLSEEKELQSNYTEKKFLRVDGEMFGWYGTHMLEAAAYFEEMVGKLA